MIKAKVIKITSDEIQFDNGYTLYSWHDQDCCESHYLDFEHIKVDDFDGVYFDLSSNTFFRRIEKYGIELVPIKGYSVKIPGYGSNNGYYSSELILVLKNNEETRKFDISECQDIDWI